VATVHHTRNPTGPNGCPGATSEGTTIANLAAGQRVHLTDELGQLPKGCSGLPVNGTVAYVPDAGLGIRGYESPPVLVGTFRSTVP
jgi:hypothetical protein